MNPNDPAFPQTVPVMAPIQDMPGAMDKIGEQFLPGLTKREYFAVEFAKSIVCGIYSNVDKSNILERRAEDVMTEGIKMAEALIAELSK